MGPVKQHSMGGGVYANPSMARKQGWWVVSRRYVACMLVVLLLSAGLVLLQHFCMMHKAGDFTTSYCMSDTHMRAVIAAILTFMGLALTAAVTSAVEAFRSMQLSKGINEGVYIALTTQNVRYHLRAMSTPWARVMLLIVLAINAPQSLQTLVNLGIKTEGVYVRNRSTAAIYDAYSYYNATEVPVNFATLESAITMLAKMGTYRTSATSRLINDGHDVVTSVLRDGYVGETQISDSDVTNAFRRLETVVSIASSCTSTFLKGPLSTVVPSSNSKASLNVTDTEGALHYADITVYTLLYEIMPGNSIYFNSTISLAMCYSTTNAGCSSVGPDTIVTALTTTCASTLVAQDQIMIYTVSADSVTPVQLVSNTTTVDGPYLADLMVNYANSPESTPEAQDDPIYIRTLGNIYARFPTGSFNSSESNVLHTKLCASASLALQLLFSGYGETPAEFVAGQSGITGNAVSNNSALIPLYHIVQLTYVSTAHVAVVVGVIVGCACLVSMQGVIFATSSPINIKPVTDSSLLYNADRALIDKKQALQSFLSNDPDKQREVEFHPSSMLYCRDISVTYGQDTYHRLNVCQSPAPGDEVPTKSQLYC